MTHLLPAALALLSGCALDVVFPADGAPDDSGDSALPDSGDTVVRTATTPVAPTASTPMWQGLQEAFLDADGAPCTVPVAAAMGDGAFCFVAADGGLRCAGRVYDEVYGAAFVATGITDARQVHLSPTFDGPDGNRMCALGGGVLQCLGRSNATGHLANGGTNGNTTLLPWGDVTGVVGAATGTWDQFCVLDGAGDAWCAGNDHGLTPVAMGNHGALVIDTAGTPSFDDPERFRASAGRSECFVTAGGLSCGEIGADHLPGVLGEAGHVVDGGRRFTEPPTACWLDDAGRAWCGDTTTTEQIFADQPVLLLAVNHYTDSRCAIYADGAVACTGDNTNGKLGTGDAIALSAETVVAPAGTVDTRCR